jgi:hypothetical protein
VSIASVIRCDGCGSTVARGRHDAHPGTWYRVIVTMGPGPASKRLDLCSPLCASRAVDLAFDPEGHGRATHPSAAPASRDHLELLEG